MRPNPSLRPRGGIRAKLGVDTLFDQRSVPPRTNRKQRVADGQIVAIAGDAEFPDVADPARNLLAFGTSFVEVMISGAEDDAGDAGQQREVFFHHQDLGAEVD
jgi:hypothetical protein